MPKVIDLFAGVGGLSLGAARAGFDVVAAVELDKQAIETHSTNFPKTVHIQENIAELSGKTLLDKADLVDGKLAGLIGGPPCQGFSSIGKRHVNDVRNDLFVHFFRLIAETNPAFFVAENVMGILDPIYKNIREKAFSQLSDTYTRLDPIIVKANEYGVPTIRKRVFFIGYDHRRFRTDLTVDLFAPDPNENVIYVEHALLGLPADIDPNWQKAEQGWRKIHNERMFHDSFFGRIADSIPKNVGNLHLIERYIEKGEVSGCLGTKHIPEVVARFASLNYGQQDPISKAVKLNPQGFCPTLRAGTGREKGSFQAVRPVHFDKPRVITPREAARLQGFPDWFVFHPTKWHSFRQIGNSVSPIAAEKILQILFDSLRN